MIFHECADTQAELLGVAYGVRGLCNVIARRQPAAYVLQPKQSVQFFRRGQLCDLPTRLHRRGGGYRGKERRKAVWSEKTDRGESEQHLFAGALYHALLLHECSGCSAVPDGRSEQEVISNDDQGRENKIPVTFIRHA